MPAHLWHGPKGRVYYAANTLPDTRNNPAKQIKANIWLTPRATLPNEPIACLKMTANHYDKKKVRDKAEAEEKAKAKAKAGAKAKVNEVVNTIQYPLLSKLFSKEKDWSHQSKSKADSNAWISRDSITEW